MPGRSMIDWQQLFHAYGTAADIPALLDAIEAFPAETDWRAEPWFSLWSALYHQGDIYPASIAAVPRIVSTLACEPTKATLSSSCFRLRLPLPTTPVRWMSRHHCGRPSRAHWQTWVPWRRRHFRSASKSTWRRRHERRCSSRRVGSRKPALCSMRMHLDSNRVMSRCGRCPPLYVTWPG